MRIINVEYGGNVYLINVEKVAWIEINDSKITFEFPYVGDEFKGDKLEFTRDVLGESKYNELKEKVLSVVGGE